MIEPRTERRIAAIVAADVVGYTRLMEQDEAGTLAALKGRRRTVVEPIVVPSEGSTVVPPVVPPVVPVSVAASVVVGSPVVVPWVPGSLAVVDPVSVPPVPSSLAGQPMSRPRAALMASRGERKVEGDRICRPRASSMPTTKVDHGHSGGRSTRDTMQPDIVAMTAAPGARRPGCCVDRSRTGMGRARARAPRHCCTQ